MATEPRTGMYLIVGDHEFLVQTPKALVAELERNAPPPKTPYLWEDMREVQNGGRLVVPPEAIAGLATACNHAGDRSLDVGGFSFSVALNECLLELRNFLNASINKQSFKGNVKTTTSNVRRKRDVADVRCTTVLPDDQALTLAEQTILKQRLVCGTRSQRRLRSPIS